MPSRWPALGRRQAALTLRCVRPSRANALNHRIDLHKTRDADHAVTRTLIATPTQASAWYRAGGPDTEGRGGLHRSLESCRHCSLPGHRLKDV